MTNGNDMAHLYLGNTVSITESCTPENIKPVMTRILNTIKVHSEIKIKIERNVSWNDVNAWISALDRQVTVSGIQYDIERVSNRTLLVGKAKVQELLIERLTEVEALLINGETVKGYIKLHAIIANLNVDKDNNHDR